MTDTLSLDDLEAIKKKQQATWASGNYAAIGTRLQIVGESLCEAVDVAAGWQVLDVAAGNGNASLGRGPSGLRGHRHRLRRRPARAGTPARRGRWAAAHDPCRRRRGPAVRRRHVRRRALDLRRDVHAEPLAGRRRAASRCRPGGRIGLANWTPDGFVGGMFKIIGAHVPPPAGVPSPLAWGTEERLHDLFGPSRVEVTRRQFTFRYRSAQEFFETFKSYYGPTVRAWGALDDAGRASLSEQLVALADGANRRTDGTLAVPSDYLEVVVTKGS